MTWAPYLAEFIGTFVLVFGGCGAAILAGGSIGYVGISFAFGLSLLAMAFAVGHVSGCHVNPAVSVGLAVSGRLPWKHLPGYVAAQVLGAIASAWTIFWIAKSHMVPADPLASGVFACNGYGLNSPAGFTGEACFVAEALLTFLLVFTILGSTSAKAPPHLAGLPIGLVLVLIHLVGIPITNTSVNPARSTGPATVYGKWALDQLWLFWVAPVVGALVAAMAHRVLERAKR